jgi:hypothetical protein
MLKAHSYIYFNHVLYSAKTESTSTQPCLPLISTVRNGYSSSPVRPLHVAHVATLIVGPAFVRDGPVRLGRRDEPGAVLPAAVFAARRRGRPVPAHLVLVVRGLDPDAHALALELTTIVACAPRPRLLDREAYRHEAFLERRARELEAQRDRLRLLPARIAVVGFGAVVGVL